MTDDEKVREIAPANLRAQAAEDAADTLRNARLLVMRAYETLPVDEARAIDARANLRGAVVDIDGTFVQLASIAGELSRLAARVAELEGEKIGLEHALTLCVDKGSYDMLADRIVSFTSPEAVERAQAVVRAGIFVTGSEPPGHIRRELIRRMLQAAAQGDGAPSSPTQQEG